MLFLSRCNVYDVAVESNAIAPSLLAQAVMSLSIVYTAQLWSMVSDGDGEEYFQCPVAEEESGPRGSTLATQPISGHPHITQSQPSPRVALPRSWQGTMSVGATGVGSVAMPGTNIGGATVLHRLA